MGVHLKIEGVGRRFSQKQGEYIAVRDINLEVQPGEVVSIIGHSGCGKSTVLNMIAGLDKPSVGQMTLDGQPVKGPGRDRGMVFQHHGLLPWLSIYDNVLVAVQSAFDEQQSGKERRTERAVQSVGLWEHRHKKPGQISGGMKQRTAVARAFAIEPKMLLLDEPFGALDALTKASLHEELVSLWSADKEHKTVLIVTHDIDEAIYLSDRVVVMTNGPAATIAEVVDVQLPRPRDKRQVAYLPAYAELRDHLLGRLTRGPEARMAV